jgi:DNA polymerase-3 subunit epsilon
MREIVLDTETTGLDPESGDRVVEIACVELVRCIPSGRVWHRYLNPERDMPQKAFEIHGLSTAFLADKPKFAELAEEFAGFIAEARLVIHNAAFDVKFLNAELSRVGRQPIGAENVIDTLALARRKHPGAQNTLDALCRRYGIDNSARVKHGALTDAELLAEVYLNLIDARQPGFELEASGAARPGRANGGRRAEVRRRPAPLPSRVTEAEAAAHREFLSRLKAGAIWLDAGAPEAKA